MTVDQLKQFFERVKSWPQTQEEVDSAASELGRLLDAAFVGFLVNLISDKQVHVHSAEGDRVCGTAGEWKRSFYWQTSQPNQIQKGSQGDSWNQLIEKILVEVDRSKFDHHFEFMGSSFNIISQKICFESTACAGVVMAGFASPGGPEKRSQLALLAHHLENLLRIADLNIAVQVRNQFLSIASHELKTPLTSIYGVLQLQDRMLRLKVAKTKEHSQEQERQLHYMKVVIRQTERLNSLIDGLLDVSRIQSGRFAIEPAETDVAMVLRDTVQNRLNLIASEAGVKIQVEVMPTLKAWIDPIRLEEVITNLVMNAIRFSPEGGVVRVKLLPNGEGFRLRVADQGPNIPTKDRERIFQPFERAERTSRMGGLGLGLFISRQIALLHGGNVRLLESLPGKGNIFESAFPGRGSQSEDPLFYQSSGHCAERQEN